MSSGEEGTKIRQLLQARRWREAAPLLERWTLDHPRHTPGWWWRARCLEQLGRTDEALSCAETARALAPADTRLDALVARLERLHGSRVEPAATLLDGETRDHPVEGGAPQTAHAMDTTGADPAATAVGPAPEEEAAADGADDHTFLEAERRPAHAGTVQRWSIGDVIEGRYEVRSRTRGGMGEVYFVVDHELGLDVAVKTPLPSALASTAGRARFLREAEAWIALGLHPNICTAFYVRDIDGLPRLFIEYVDGGTLDEWVQHQPEAPLSTRLDLAIQVAAGMHHAHIFSWRDDADHEHHGLVHRDLKPANVLVGSNGVARVTDFGLVGRGALEDVVADDEGPPSGIEPVEATPVEIDPGSRSTGSVWGTVTVGGRVMGSPPYMAPEQWEGAHAAGPPADVYAFGCLLYELVCGRRPFAPGPRYAKAGRAVQIKAWEHLHRQEPVPDPRHHGRGLGDSLCELMQACLAKEPEERPSFADVGATLRTVYSKIAGQVYPRSEPRAGELLADSWCNRGVSYASLEQTQRAMAAWREALRVDPQHGPAGFNLALAEWFFGGAGDRELIHRVAASGSHEGSAWRHRLLVGRSNLCVGDYPAAADALLSAAESSGNAAEVVRDLVLAQSAVATSSEDSTPWHGIAEIVEGDEGWIRRDAAALTCAAVARERLGDDEASRAQWARARQALADPPEALRHGAERLIPGATLAHRSTAFAGRISALTTSPDGRLGLTGGDDGRLMVWDLESDEPRRTLHGGEERVRCVAVLPGSNLGLAARGHEAVMVWDLSTGTSRRSLQAHNGYLNALAVSADGRTGAGVGSAGSVFVWDLSSGRRLHAARVHEGFAQCVALSADAEVVLSGGGDGTVQLLVLGAEKRPVTLRAHSGGVTALGLDAGGRWLLSGGEDRAVRLWDLSTHRCTVTLEGHAGVIHFVALDRSHQRAVSAAADGTLRVWSLDPPRLLKVETLGEAVTAGAAGAAWAVVLLAHGATLSRFSLTETPRYDPAWSVAVVISASEADRRTRQYRQHLESVRRLAEQDDFESAFTMIERARGVAGYERAREALELEAELGALFPRGRLRDAWGDRELTEGTVGLTAVAVSPVGQHALTTDRQRRLVVWHWQRGESLASITCPTVAVAAAFVADARTAVTAHLDNVLRFWDLDRGVCTLAVGGHDARVHALATDGHGGVVVSAAADHTARVWDATTGAALHVLRGHLGEVRAVTVRSDGRLAVTGGDDGTLVVWDLDLGTSVGELGGHIDAVVGLSLSADGRTLLSAGRDGTVTLWDILRGRRLRTFEVDGTPSAIGLSADGRHALIGSTSGTLSLWYLRDRRCVRVLDGHTGSITGAALTPSDRWIVSTSADGSARVWHLDWEPRIRPFAQWDESARPHLELFLSRHTPRQVRHAPRPEWNDSDVQRLLGDLRDCGFGWLRPDGVRRRLDELEAGWGGMPQIALQGAATGTSYSRSTRRTWVRRGVGAAVVLVPVLIGLVLLLGWQSLHLASNVAKERRQRDMVARVGPAQVARPADCDPKQLQRYIRDFVELTDRPGDWMTANYCLAALEDPRVVPPLLDILRPKTPDPIAEQLVDEQLSLQIGSDPRQVLAQLRTAMAGGFDTKASLQSMFARIGDRAIPELVKALGDREPAVRATAARALALGSTEQSIQALVDGAGDPRHEVRQAVAGQLESIACSRALSTEEAFRLTQTLAADRDVEVRRATARAVGIFAGSRARSLMRLLADDEDPTVSETARRHLERR